MGLNSAQEVISTYVSASEQTRVTSSEALEAARFLAKFPEIIPDDYLETVYNLASKHKWNPLYWGIPHDEYNFGLQSQFVLEAVAKHKEKIAQAKRLKTPIARLRVLLGF